MKETFIKLDRSLLRHRYFGNVNVLKVWLWCLLKASHAPHTQLVGLQTVELQPGEFVTGRHSAATDLKISGSTAWTILQLFKRDGKINIKSNNKFSVISVIDFYSYQVLKYQSRQQTDSKRTANGQQTDTNKNEKNEKNEKNRKPLQAKKPPADSRLFSDWFCYAFKQITEYPYSFESGKDGKLLSEMLQKVPVKNLVAKACHFLLDPERFPKNKAPTIAFLKSKLNDYPDTPGDQMDRFREAALLPPEGMKLEEWQPWTREESPQVQ